MATGLPDLPEELQVRVAEFVPKADLLALRCSSGACKETVIRAVKHHEACKRFSPIKHFKYHSHNESMDAIGRVFGAGCRELEITWMSMGSLDCPFELFESFVTSTGGLLRELSICGRTTEISPDKLLTLCRACPLLKSLIVTHAYDMPVDAVAISQACPLLEHVELPARSIGLLSPAETYARHFPRITCLNFMRRGLHGHDPNIETPVRFDVIAVAAEKCVHATKIMCPTDATVTPEFVGRLLATPLRHRVTNLCFGGFPYQVLPETCLQLVRGFPNLLTLTCPCERALGPAMPRTEFFEHLALAAPMLRVLIAPDVDDECMNIICNQWQLEEITFFICTGAFSRCVTTCGDIIGNSSSATSLRKALVVSLEAGWSSAELLGIVQGCPNLVDVWWINYPGDFATLSGSAWEERKTHLMANLQAEARADIACTRRLLKSRGGRLQGTHVSSAKSSVAEMVERRVLGASFEPATSPRRLHLLLDVPPLLFGLSRLDY